MAGLESRTSILPTPKIPTNNLSIYGPDYNFSDNLPMPNEVGIYAGNSIDSVIDSIAGAAYYADMIGFGVPSNPMSATVSTNLKPMIPIGLRSFTKTGMQCTNGADMWMYNNGIPDGSALGAGFARKLAATGFPPMQGLAPGIIEDAKSALDPEPIMSAVFGSGYPVCEYKVLPVGDQYGRIKNPETGKYYVENPETVQYVPNYLWPPAPMWQGRWIKKAEVTQEEAEKTPKTFCPDGYPLKSHKDTDCAKDLISLSMEPFIDNKNKEDSLELLKMIGAVTGVLLTIGLVHRYFIR